MIKIIRSGGQTGADIAGIRAAHSFGVQTTGAMPKGFKTLNGPRPEYAQLYGMYEHPSSDYPPRTEENVILSDATIRFAFDFNSSGEKCTLRAIKKYNKPFFDVHISDPTEFRHSLRESPEAASLWILLMQVTHLNIAGNSEKTCPGIEKWVEKYVTEMLKYLKDLGYM